VSGKRRLRARLAGLYACLLLGSGLLLLLIADLPLITFGRAQAHTAAGRSGPARSFTNLPEVLAYSAVALAVLAVASVGLGWLVADRALRPLRVITAAARTASASSLDARLSVVGAYEEFRELGGTLNGLFARLEAAFESQRQFVANASHELRTPLAATRTVLQVALADPAATAESLRAACQQVIQLGEQQEHLVDALLTLAAGQSGLRHREPFDLAEVTARVVASRQPDADRRDLTVAASLGPAVVTGDLALAESLVANLVDNAVRHNGPGGHVRVSTGTGSGRPRLSVANSGPVVPPGEVGRLLEPFRQLDGERAGPAGGHGLGMAIVAAVAGAHAADLAVRARPEGGLDVTVTFPLLALRSRGGPISRPSALEPPSAAGRRQDPAAAVQPR
jgi:signal transduction histidine kinase